MFFDNDSLVIEIKGHFIFDLKADNTGLTMSTMVLAANSVFLSFPHIEMSGTKCL